MEASVSSSIKSLMTKYNRKIYRPVRDKNGNFVKELVTDPQEFLGIAEGFKRAQERKSISKEGL